MAKKTIKILKMTVSSIENFTFLYDNFYEQVGKKLGVDIEYEAISWNHSIDTISQKLKSDNPPDLFQLGSTWISAYADMGFLDTVPSSFPKYEPLADWLEDICMFKGKKVCLPWFADTYMLFANRQHIQRMRLEEKSFSTTEGLLETCGNIIKDYSCDPFYKNCLPLALQIRPDHDTINLLMPWLRSYGWNIDELKYPLFGQEVKTMLYEFFNYLKRLMESARLDRNIMAKPGYAVDYEFFLENRYTFSITRWWKLILDMYRQKDMDINYVGTHEAFRIPAGPDTAAPFAGGSMLCVPSNAKHKAEAWAVAAELMSDEHYGRRSRINGDVPAIVGGFWKNFEGDPRTNLLYSHIQSAKHYPMTPMWLATERILSSAICDFAWNYIFEDKPFDKLYNTILANADKRIQSVSNYYWS